MKTRSVTPHSPKPHAGQIELAVVALLNYRRFVIVPNVSWGLGLNYEADLLALDPQNRFTEIEIKTTPGDLRADFKKSRYHDASWVSRLCYAVPEDLVADVQAVVKPGVGIIAVSACSHGIGWKARWIRQARHNALCREPSDAVIKKFMSLGCMRIWSLKLHNYNK